MGERETPLERKIEGVSPAPSEGFERAASQAGGVNKLDEMAEGVKEMARVGAKILMQAMDDMEKVREKIRSGDVGNVKKLEFELTLTSDTARKLMQSILRFYREVVLVVNVAEGRE